MGNASPTGPAAEPWLVIFPFLQKLQPEDQRYFWQHHVRRCPDPQTTGLFAYDGPTQLFAQDAPITHLYIVIEGTVSEERTPSPGDQEPYPLRRRVVGTTLNQNDPTQNNPERIIIGIYDLLYRGKYSTSAYAHAATTLYQIDVSGIDWLMARAPAISEELAPLKLIERLRTMPLFVGLTPVALGFLADEFQRNAYTYYVPGATIYPMQNPADTLYLLDRGQVYLEWPDDRNRWLGNSAAFGWLEMDEALLGAATLSHRAVAAKHASVLRIARRAFRRITGLNPDIRGQEAYAAMAKAVNELPIFAGFTPEQRHRLLGYLSHYCLPNPHILVQQGELNDSLWLLLPQSRAQVHALRPSGDAYQSIGVEGPAYFGEAALHAELPMGATIEGEEGSQWVRLHRRDLEQFSRDLGQDLKTRLPRPLGPAPAQPQPQFTGYEWLQSGESIQWLSHRHWIQLLRKVLPSLVILGGLLALSLAVAFGLVASGGWVYWVISSGGLLMMGQVAWGLIDYLNDSLIITNRRVVLQEEVLFFKRWRYEAALDRIENVDIRIGFWGKLLGYGNIVMRTAAEQGALSFAFVVQPDVIEQKVTELRDLRRIDDSAKKRGSVQHLLAGRLRLRLQLPAQVCLPAGLTAPPESWWRKVRRWVKELLLWRSSRLSDEQHVVWRKHWLILLGRLTPALGIPLLIFAFLLWQLFWVEPVPRTLLTLDILLLFLVLGNLFWMAWIVADWRNDTYEVTTATIVDSEKKPLFFDEKRRTARLDEIENIEVSVPSLFHYLFNFGSVRLQTASSDGDFTFDHVSNPHAVATEVQRRMEEYQTRQRLDDAQRRAQELPDWFDMYDLLGGVSKRRSRPPLA